MKKSYVVIGMGRFGTSVAERLYELGNEVLAIDTNPDKVQRMESKVTCAVVADVRDEEVLRSLGARSCDCAVVAIGSDLATCIIATLNLKDLGVPQVICKATDELRKKALEKVGADRVVIPERETGITPTLCTASKLILIVFMFFGRVGIMTIGVGFMMGDRAKERVQYAQTKVMIG